MLLLMYLHIYKLPNNKNVSKIFNIQIHDIR